MATVDLEYIAQNAINKGIRELLHSDSEGFWAYIDKDKINKSQKSFRRGLY